MKHIIALTIAAVALLILPACQTAGGNARTSAVGLEVALSTASEVSAFVLQKNPKALPVVVSISEGIGAVLAEESLTSERVGLFVAKVTKNAKLTKEERLYITLSVQKIHGILTAYFGTPDLNISDPKVRAALENVKRRVDAALALHAVLES
jgi:hypothetical protein